MSKSMSEKRDIPMELYGEDTGVLSNKRCMFGMVCKECGSHDVTITRRIVRSHKKALDRGYTEISTEISCERCFNVLKLHD